MRKLIVDEWMALDGVVQAPGHAEEDTDGGFAHGGWHMRYFDDVSQDWVVEGYMDRVGSSSSAARTRSSRPTGPPHPRRSRSSPDL